MTAPRLATTVRVSLRERIRLLFTGRAQVLVFGMVRTSRHASGHLLVPAVLPCWRRAFAEWRARRRTH